MVNLNHSQSNGIYPFQFYENGLLIMSHGEICTAKRTCNSIDDDGGVTGIDSLL